jgi:hypothetical protein
MNHPLSLNFTKFCTKLDCDSRVASFDPNIVNAASRKGFISLTLQHIYVTKEVFF